MDDCALTRKELLEALERLEADAISRPGFDARKVARLRQAILDGSYQVDAGSVADGLVDEALIQLAKRQSVASG